MKYLINPDCLQFRAHTDINLNDHESNGIYKFSDGLLLKSTRGDNPYYKEFSYEFCFNISLNGEDIGLMYAKSLELFTDYGSNVIIRLNNNVLYRTDLNSILETLRDKLQLKGLIIKELHICYDTPEDIMTKFRKLREDSIRKDSPIVMSKENKLFKTGGGYGDDNILVGSEKSKTKSITIYNKTKELRKSHKEYIREIHTKLFGYKTIYRLELKINYRLDDIKSIDVMKVSDKSYLETILNTYLNELIEFVDTNTGEILDFITLDNSSEKLPRNPKKKSVIGTEAKKKQVKTVINFMDKEIKNSSYKTVKQFWGLIRDILIKRYTLESWYEWKKK